MDDMVVFFCIVINGFVLLWGICGGGRLVENILSVLISNHRNRHIYPKEHRKMYKRIARMKKKMKNIIKNR